ncbi:hypothetical protein D3C78_1374960 [compost metagenome]
MAQGGLLLGPAQHRIGGEVGPVALDVARGALVLLDGQQRPVDGGVQVTDIKRPDDQALKQRVLVHGAKRCQLQVLVHVGAIFGKQFIPLHRHLVAHPGQRLEPRHVLIQGNQLQVQAVGHQACGLPGGGGLRRPQLGQDLLLVTHAR